MIRLPYGESMPPSPQQAEKRQAPVLVRVVASARAVTQPKAQLAVDQTAKRELAGPPPMASESERDGYRPETAEELGAKPLPGFAAMP